MQRSLDAIVLSTGRAASTAVYRYLDTMCGLGLPANKEPHFLCTPGNFDGVYPLLEKIVVSREQDYEELYRDSKLVLDASCGYFFCLDEVLENLERYGQHPKIVFLYREPVSRAASFFNELRRKGLEDNESLLESLRQDREPGLWWEYYYDNVSYLDGYRKLLDYSGDVLAVNYEAFRADPPAVMKTICQFLGLVPVREIEYLPVNTSAEAILQTRSGWRSLDSRWIPARLQGALKRIASEFYRHNEPSSSDVEPLLPYSMAQYREFRKLINEQDFHFG